MSGWLSGSFLAPAAFGFLLLIPVVVLLYLLKLRRTEVVIPSTLLWMKSLEDLTANAPFQRLRKNLLLLLQILALLALVLALARPFVSAEGARGKTLCCIIDRSASMQTEEEGGSRLDLAKARALELIDSLGSGDRMMLVSFAEKADVLCELTDDKGRLRAAVRGVTPEDTRSNIRDVMLIVRSMAPDDRDRETVAPDMELILMSDGNLSDLDQLGSLSTPMTYLRIGKSTKNAGITVMSVRRPENAASGERQCFLLLHNESPAPLQSTVSLFYRETPESEDSLLAVEEVTVPAASDQELIFLLPQVEAGLLRAELDAPDALALDNTAWLALEPEAYLDVLLVGEADSSGGYFLRRVLTLDPRANVSAVTPEDYQDTNEYDLIVFNGWSPLKLPAGTLMFFNTTPPVPGLKELGTVKNPAVIATERDHPLMRFLNPGNLRIGKAIQFELPEGGRALVNSQNAPLIADVSRGGQQIIVAAFDLADTNWPLHLSFPLFVQNLLSYAPGSGLSGEAGMQTGAPLRILPAPGVTKATVRRPDGREDSVDLDPVRPVFYSGTAKAGPYVVERGEFSALYAVNLLDRNESAITPAASLDLGDAAIAASTGPLRYDRELWRWGIVAGLLLLLVEWWIYSRRADLG